MKYVRGNLWPSLRFTGDPQEALKLMEREQPRLVLLDW